MMKDVFFISGHLDLLEEEFNAHYIEAINNAVQLGSSFVIGDARGADTLAQKYLFKRTNKVLIYHMFSSPRNNAGFQTKGGFNSDSKRDKQMTLDSTGDICWVRAGRENSGTANNLKRRFKAERRTQ